MELPRLVTLLGIVVIALVLGVAAAVLWRPRRRLAVGLLAGLRGGRALWALPASFLALMAVGAGLGMAGFALPLAEAGISVFTISTYDTDWVLVPKDDADRAAQEWERRGHTVVTAVPVTSSSKHQSSKHQEKK